MKPSRFEHSPRGAMSSLVAPGITLPELIDDLASRLSPAQRGAFLAKMAAMDRQLGLTSATVVLGRA